MADYEIVEKASVPPAMSRKGYGKWASLFATLEPDKALRITFKSQQKAQNQGRSLQGSFRHARHNGRIHIRIVREAPDMWTVYAWKEALC